MAECRAARAAHKASVTATETPAWAYSSTRKGGRDDVRDWPGREELFSSRHKHQAAPRIRRKEISSLRRACTIGSGVHVVSFSGARACSAIRRPHQPDDVPREMKHAAASEDITALAWRPSRDKQDTRWGRRVERIRDASHPGLPLGLMRSRPGRPERLTDGREAVRGTPPRGSFRETLRRRLPRRSRL